MRRGETVELCKRVLQAAALVFLVHALLCCDRRDAGSGSLQQIDPLLFRSATELTGAIRRGEITSLELLRRCLDSIKRYDVLLTPVATTVAFPHNHLEPVTSRRLEINGKKKPYLFNPAWVSTAIVSGLPATVCPVGLSESGLPVGIQIIGARFEDRTTIAFARGLSELVGGFKAPPGLME